MTNKTLLLIDTSCPQAAIGIAQNKQIITKQYIKETNRVCALLPEYVDQALSEARLKFADIEVVVPGTGPGSFIGCRIAIAYCKGICMALKIPLLGISTLKAIASDNKLPKGFGHAIINAKRGEVYTQKFEKNINNGKVEVNSVSEVNILLSDKIDDLLDNNAFLTGFSNQQIIHDKFFQQDGPSVDGLLHAFLQKSAAKKVENEVDYLIPNYSLQTDAIRPKPQ